MKCALAIALLLPVSALLVGCAADDGPSGSGGISPSGDVVAFSPLIPNAVPGRQTRGSGVIDNANLQEVHVATYVNRRPYVTDIILSRQGAVWQASPTVYWPVNGDVNFFSYAPELPSVSSFQVTHSEVTDTARVHYFVSDFTTDLLYGCNYGLNRRSGQVKIDLRHAMSRLHFLFRNKPGSFTVCHIYRVDIVNVLDRGDFVFPLATTTESNSPLGRWVMDTMLNYKDIIIRQNPTLVGDTARVLDDLQPDLLVIPQQVTKVLKINQGGHYAQGIYLAIRCLFTAPGMKDPVWPSPESPGYDPTTGSAYIFVPLRLESCTEWKQGYYYTYTVNLAAPQAYNPDDINFLVTVSIYDDNGGTTISN